VDAVDARPAVEVPEVVAARVERPPGLEAAARMLMMPSEELVEGLLPRSRMQARARCEHAVQLEHAPFDDRAETQPSSACARPMHVSMEVGVRGAGEPLEVALGHVALVSQLRHPRPELGCRKAERLSAAAYGVEAVGGRIKRFAPLECRAVEREIVHGPSVPRSSACGHREVPPFGCGLPALSEPCRVPPSVTEQSQL
jgi:hypothetical protein